MQTVTERRKGLRATAERLLSSSCLFDNVVARLERDPICSQMIDQRCRAKIMEAVNSIKRELTIEADAATVFAFFTDPERLTRWMGVSAELEPRPGGLFLVDVLQGWVARGEYKEVVPVTRLAYTWGWEGSNENVPPGSSLIEVDLVPNNGSTLVRFSHSGLPVEAVPGHAEGWTHYLARLVVAASGGDPGPDPRRNQP